MPLLQPELVHVEESVGILLLEDSPVLKIRCCRIIWKAPVIVAKGHGFACEPKEAQAVCMDEILNLFKGQAMLLNMEKQVPACAEAIEIGGANSTTKRFGERSDDFQ